MTNITPETLEQMRNFNTVIGFIICVVFVIFCYGNMLYQIGFLIVSLIKFIIRKIKEKKKGTAPDEDTHTEH